MTNELYHMSQAMIRLFNFGQTQSQNYIYGLIVILLVAWLAFSTYLLFYKPRVLEKWKYPTLCSLTIITLIGISSFFVAYFFINFLDSLFYLFRNIVNYKELSNPFLVILVVMFFYIIFALNRSKSQKSESNDFIPAELKLFIPESFSLAVALFFFYSVFFGLALVPNFMALGGIENITIKILFVFIIPFIMGSIILIAIYRPVYYNKWNKLFKEKFKISLSNIFWINLLYFIVRLLF
ncbi:MAG: hypothetical protein KAR87_03485 [Candidatus Aenigmarchaeota archaeon]|nr:hypothetical protein [Candidatus Aenigmarchaeota archaeon]